MSSGAMRRLLCSWRLAATLRVPVRGFADSAFSTAPTYYSRDEVTNRVLTVVKNFPKVNVLKVSPAAHFQKDLGLDSLDAVEMVMALEDEFKIEIPDGESDKIVSCADAIEYIVTRPRPATGGIHHDD